ncbi:MAG TPA: DUF2851 family protein [Dehalococcoidia bacterium]|nr:DUF2851 family protein [Dehalococcoidia bacterium]
MSARRGVAAAGGPPGDAGATAGGSGDGRADGPDASGARRAIDDGLAEVGTAAAVSAGSPRPAAAVLAAAPTADARAASASPGSGRPLITRGVASRHGHPSAPAHTARFSPSAAPTRSGAARAGEAPLTEAQLARLWRGQRFPEGALATRHGVPVTVIFQGRAGRGPGPDFRGAVIAGPSGVALRGDVELHVRSSSFRAHGHHADPAYAGVILHVVFEDDTGADTPLPGGGSAPVVALAPWVARRARELEGWLERPLLWREPCHDAVMRMGADGAGAALDAEGERRFAAKTARMASAVGAAGTDGAVYEGLLEALGYGGNAPPMLALARLLPWPRLRDRAGGGGRAGIEALLLGSAGLLPSQRGHRGPVEAYVAELEARFAAARLPSLAPGIWKTRGVRPENAPARRVAAAAALLARAGPPSSLLAIAEAGSVREAVAPLVVSAEGYWLRHHDVCAGPCRLPAGFIGRSRALEIIVNVVLPATCAAGDEALAARARRLFARLPRPAVYGATRFIEEALASEGIRVPVDARRAQGLLALQRDWCPAGGCGRCPLSETGGRREAGDSGNEMRETRCAADAGL